MKIYKAFVKDKQTKKAIFIESEYKTKTAFIKDLRSNGYIVNNYHVQEKEVFDWVMENTNAGDEDFKAGIK